MLKQMVQDMDQCRFLLGVRDLLAFVGQWQPAPVPVRGAMSNIRFISWQSAF
jgi:hypothetical protein